MRLADLALAVGGKLVDTGAMTGDAMVSGNVFVDSREPSPDGLFVAIPGDRVDGHDFAASTVRAGAAAALVERAVGVPAIVVDDTVKALGRLAAHLVTLVPELAVIEVTGSQGKTGTKDMLRQLLETVGPTVAPVGSYNTEIGMPLTATAVSTSTRYLILELGARGRGHISYLTSLVPPHVGVVLNVGVAHIGQFGSREAIAAAKGELVEALPAKGVAVLNADDPFVVAMRHRTAARVVTFGYAPDADVRVEDVRLDERGWPDFDLVAPTGRARVRLPLVGEHQVLNAAAAAAAASALGLPIPRIAEVLGTIRHLSRWRMEVTTTPTGVTVINDAYNANPDSTRAALRTLTQIGGRREPPARTIAVLGEMCELGETAEAAHESIGRFAAERGVTMLVAVGEAAVGIHLGATSDRSWHGTSVCVADPAQAAEFVGGQVRRGDVVLIKASRAAGLETAAAILAEKLPEEVS